MSTVFWIILALTAQVTLLAMASTLVQRLALKSRPLQSSRLLTLTSALMLLLTVGILMPLPSWFSQTGEDPKGQTSQLTNEAIELSEGPHQESTIQREFGAAPLSLPPLSVADRIQSLSRAIDQSRKLKNEPVSNWLAVGVKSLAVTVSVLLFVGLCQFGIGLIALRRLKSKSRKAHSPLIADQLETLCHEIGCQRAIEVYLCSEMSTAATVGSLKPHIFLADDFETWDEDSQKSVLAHEIAHIHHRDFEANIVSQVCRLLHFFNPAVHWMTKQLRLQQELAADRVAANATTGPVSYSRTLASLALRQDTARPALASMFLPEESDFVCRIKTLRQEIKKQNRFGGWLLPLTTILIAVAICGIRVPAAAIANPLLQESEETAFDLSWIDPQGSISCMRPTELKESSLMSQLIEHSKGIERQADAMGKEFEVATGLGIEHIDQLILCVLGNSDFRDRYTIYKTFEDNLENFKSKGEIVGQEVNFPIEILRKGDQTGHEHGLILDERTVLYTWKKETIDKIKSVGKDGHKQAKWLRNFEKLAKKQVVMMLDDDATYFIQGIFDGELKDQINNGTNKLLSIDLKDEAKFEVRMSFTSSSDAEALEQRTPDIKKALLKTFAPMAQASGKHNKLFAKSAVEGISNMEVKRVGNELTFSATIEIDFAKLAEAAEDMNEADIQVQAMNNMRQVTLALLNYESAYGELPSATMVSESGHEYSWRIAILPFLEQNEVHEQYHFDEPWDSAHNKRATSEMPECFKHPSSDSKTDTNFFVITGPGTIFPPAGNVTFADMKDGTSNTVLLVEAIRDRHWAKPGGMSLEEAIQPGTLGGFAKGQIKVTMMDGSTHSISNKVTPEILAGLYSIDGGEPINLNDLLELD